MSKRFAITVLLLAIILATPPGLSSRPRGVDDKASLVHDTKATASLSSANHDSPEASISNPRLRNPFMLLRLIRDSEGRLSFTATNETTLPAGECFPLPDINDPHPRREAAE